MTNQEVSHNFIYGNEGKASNLYSSTGKNNTMLLHSYNSLLAVYFISHNTILINKSIATHSNTSIKHHALLLRAVAHNIKIIYVEDNIDVDNMLVNFNVDLLTYKNELLLNLHLKQEQARTRDYSYAISTAITELKYIIKSGVFDKRTKAYAISTAIINSDIKDLVIRAKKIKKIKDDEKALRKYQSNLRRLELFTGVSLKKYTASELEKYDFLKIENNNILKTSSRVSVNLNEANILYKMLLTNKNIIGKTIGYYTILKHSEKSITIGCNNILKSELKRVLS